MVLKARKLRAHAQHVERTYSITGEQYAAIYEYQGGVCAICRISRGARKRLAVDHRHSDGEVRGLLCGTCNSMIGRMRDNAEAFDRAAAYLRDPPARMVLRDRTD